MRGLNTIREASTLGSGKIPRGVMWISKNIELGRIKAEIIGNYKLISDAECQRVRKNLDKFKVSREEMFGSADIAGDVGGAVGNDGGNDGVGQA